MFLLISVLWVIGTAIVADHIAYHLYCNRNYGRLVTIGLSVIWPVTILMVLIANIILY